VVTDAAFLIPPSLHVAALLLGDGGMTIRAVSAATEVRCPVCGDPADRVHSCYVRTLADLPWAGIAVRLHVHARTFFCDNPTCPRTIVAERLEGIAAIHARRTDRQRQDLEAIALALGGEAGARPAGDLGMPASPDTLLRLIRRSPEAEAPPPLVLGVDDWAIHKGLSCGLTATAPRFSSSRSTLRMPGIGTVHGFWASSQASATWAGVACFRRAMPPSRSTRARFAFRASGVKRGWCSGCRCRRTRRSRRSCR
jgi:hypothetical protein